MRRWRDSPEPRPCDVLVVCTANICRSPYIAALLRAQCPALSITSAGTAARRGFAAAPEIVAALERRGLGSGLEPSRPLTRRLVRGAGLVITATRAHRVSVVAADRSAAERTFTLKELARLLREGPRVADAAAAHASAATPADTRLLEVGEWARAALACELISGRDYDDDLDDPYGLDEHAYATMTAEVDEALTAVVRALNGAHETRGG